MKKEIGLGLLMLASAASAQTNSGPVVPVPATVKKEEPKPAPPPAPSSSAADNDMASVTVSAERPTNRIDRQVYDVKSDVSSTNGSAADALNNVPSVAVDPDGTVSLRGSTHVQILIDGKPSAMLQGDNRGAALNAIPAEDIDSVEVINNPGAQFGNEAGGGPIINLVMRRNRRPGGYGVVNANTGIAGRKNAAVNGSYNEGLWGFQGGVNFRRDGRNSVGEAVRDRIDPADGSTSHSTQDSIAKGLNDSKGVNGSVNYNIGQNDTLGASASYQHRSNDQHSQDRYRTFDEAEALVGDYVRNTQRDGNSRNYGWGARWDHKGKIPGESLKLDLRVTGSDNDSNSDYTNVYAVMNPGVVNTHSMQAYDASTRISDFTGDYERPDDEGLLKLGYKISGNRNSFNTQYTNIDPYTLYESLNTQRSNRFVLNEKVYALYASYQLRLGERWGVLGGLRTEYTDMDINQLTTNVLATNRYINYIPSFFASYKAGEETNLRFAYAHRIKRPAANDLNPFVVYRDEFNVSSGNPRLKPTQTDSVELGYETKLAGLETNLRAYFSRDTDSILDRKYFISDTVLLTTRENVGNSHAGGLEFTMSGKVMPGLSLNFSSNLSQRENRFLDQDGSLVQRTASSLSGKLRVNYQVADADLMQVTLQAQGRTLSGQGYRKPNSTVNFTLRHTLTPALNMVLNVTDLFDQNRIETVTQTSILDETISRRSDGRLIYFGLSYRFGSNAAGSGRAPRAGRGPGGPVGGPGSGPPGGAA
ncbi:TonB-dependent receptor domain-containing protein [Pseudoduganella sp. RAF53_2]|uniref:TonB-dependent receptor domain-containing protein n=1 Tax=unclassified Pseudoduganella TaxID=2637179 RepID=UPI003F97CA99